MFEHVLFACEDLPKYIYRCSNKNLDKTIIRTTHQYEVDFTYDELTDITANFIAERIYAQCDKDGNDMLLLDSFVDYKNMEQVLSLKDQQLTVNGIPLKKRPTAGW